MTEEYGLIGRELGHSRSPQIWSGLFAALPDAASVHRRYDLFPLPSITALPSLIAGHPFLRGFNVTIPYKETVLPYLNALTEEARDIGAVNTVLIDRSGSQPRLIGHNTDACGFLMALRKAIAPRLIPAGAAILGTGGAAKAVSCALTATGTDVVCVSRNPAGEHQIGYDRLAERMPELIVNATPLGMYPDTDSLPPIPYGLITSRHILFDLVYNPARTRFMEQGEARGAIVANGLEMLHEQAREALRFFLTQAP